MLLFINNILIFLLLILSFPAHAEDQETLKIAIKPSEPWVMYDVNLPPEKRKPVGFSIELWQGIAKEIGVNTQWVYENNVPDLLKSVQDGRADAGISAITIRSDREEDIDFSNSMFELGLQIMVPEGSGTTYPIMIAFNEIKKFLIPVNISIFLLALFFMSHLRWWVDKWSSKESRIFSRHYWHGLYDAFWWSITMLLTWEAPKNRGLARLIDLSWHFVGLVALGILTGIVAASLTIQAIGGAINSEQDLPGKKVAAVATDAPRNYLENIGARVVPVSNLEQGIDLLLKGEVDALVHDGPRLLYMAKQINQQKKTGVAVLPALFNNQNYGIIFPNGSQHLETVNRALLKLREQQGLNKSFHKQLREKWIPQTN